MTALVARPVSQQRSANQRHALVATAHTRLMMLMFLFGAAVLVVVGRLGMLAVQASLADPQARSAAIAARGDIVDRNGAPLARTIVASGSLCIGSFLPVRPRTMPAICAART